MSSTTIIKDWPDGLTWGHNSAEWLILAEKGRCNIWGKSTHFWLEWQGSPANSRVDGLKPKQFVLPLEYLT